MVLTRKRHRAAICELFLALGVDVLSHILDELFKCQGLQKTAAAARVCTIFAEAVQPLIRRLDVASRLAVSSDIGRPKFNIARHSLHGLRDGRLWCCDMNNHRVLQFDIDSGELVNSITGFEYPWFLAARRTESGGEGEGEYFVAETSGSRISVFSASGVRLRQWQMKHVREADSLLPAPPGVPAHMAPQRSVWTQGIAVWGDELYAARPEEGLISVHDTATGQMLRSFAVDFRNTYFGISMALIDGLIFVTVPMTSAVSNAVNGAVRVLTREGELVHQDFCRGTSHSPTGICKCGELICVASFTQRCLAMYTRDGVLVRRHRFPDGNETGGGQHDAHTFVNPVLLSCDDWHIYASAYHNVIKFVFGEACQQRC
jgi:hypothetical protein